MRKFLGQLVFVLSVALAPISAQANETWYGFYMQGQKVGFTNYITQSDPENHEQILRASRFEFDAAMLGQELKISIESKTWLTKSGDLVKTRQITNSSGRVNDVTATFFPGHIQAEMVTNGDKTIRKIPIPDGAKLVDDPLAGIDLNSFSKSTQSQEAYVFASDSLTLQKIGIKYNGKVKVEVLDLVYNAHHISISDPRAPLEIYLDNKGDLIKATGPLGMEYRPESKEKAMSRPTSGGDLALASSIPVKGSLPLDAKSAVYKVTNYDITNLPQDISQSLNRTEDSQILTVNPITKPNQKTTITQAAKEKEEWTKPDIRVPSDSARFKSLSAEIIGAEKSAYLAGQKLRKYVHNLMQVDAGIGVMRDANEILDSKEGVCRDHAILLGTLTRSAGIPTRFISGIVYTGQDFLYHAWVEIWDGSNWIALDSTRPGEFITPGHIKTAQGEVGQGMTGFLLDGAKFEVLDSKTE